jgi:hypothetical protein
VSPSNVSPSNVSPKNMSPKNMSISASLLAVFAGALLVVSLSAGGAAAAATGHDHNAAIAALRVPGAGHWHRRPLLARGAALPRYDYNHPDESARGYVFVPGRGILNESCDLPTSTCSNEYRDVQ